MSNSRIKITENYIQFQDAAKLKQFVEKYSLEGENFEFEFAESVRSGGSEAYIPENIPVSESRLDKLEQFDAHNDHYRIKNTPKTIRFYILHLRKQFANLLKRSQHEFLILLYEDVSGSAIGGIITHAIYDSRNNRSFDMTLWLLKIYEQDEELFWLMARSGLYALGTAFAVHKRQSFLHRNAFQMGLVAEANSRSAETIDRGLIDFNPQQQKEYFKNAAVLAEKLHLSKSAVKAIRLQLDQNELLGLPAQVPRSDSSIFDEEDEPEHQADAIKQKQADDRNEALGRALLSIMRLTRYFIDSDKIKTDPEKKLRNLVGGLAYLSEKNLLPKFVVQPILKKCQEYKDLIAKMKNIAQVEASCTKNDPQSAWAYPKPDATQVICLNHHTDCPNFINGRPIFITGIGEASLMRFMKPGEFNKCKLAENLIHIQH